MLINLDSSDDEETMAKVQLMGKAAKLGVQLRQRESVLCNPRNGTPKCCICTSAK